MKEGANRVLHYVYDNYCLGDIDNTCDNEYFQVAQLSVGFSPRRKRKQLRLWLDHMIVKN